jgi:hypothetical protein
LNQRQPVDLVACWDDLVEPEGPPSSLLLLSVLT